MVKFHPLKVREVRRETSDAVSIAFDVPEDLQDSYRFTPGQYLTLKAEIGGEEVRRSYSICSAAGEGELRVAVKRVSDGVFSRYANDDIAAGDSIDVMEPDGRFTVQPEDQVARNYVAFAAGSGITPIMSIIKSVLGNEPDSAVTLFYGNRSVQGIIFRDELEDLKDRYHERFTLVHLLSGEVQEAPLLNGRIDAEKAGSLVDTLLQIDDVDAFLICGPGDMITSVSDALQNRGVPEAKIRFEMFTPAGGVPKSKPATVRSATPAEDGNPALEAGDADVTVILDGVRTQFKLGADGDNIMQAARAAGADAPFSCTGGVCATCRARLLEGQVEMDANFALSEEELGMGYVLTCQSHPRTQKIVVDYDGAV